MPYILKVSICCEVCKNKLHDLETDPSNLLKELKNSNIKKCSCNGIEEIVVEFCKKCRDYTNWPIKSGYKKCNGCGTKKLARIGFNNLRKK